MSISPVEIPHLELRRGLFGYKRKGVEQALDDISVSFQRVWSNRAELAERVEELEAELARHTELEQLLRQTLVSAERASQELKERARKESELVLEEAHAEARRIRRDAMVARERLLDETRRIETMLRAALDSVTEAVPEKGEPKRPVPEVVPAPEPDAATDPRLNRAAG